MPIVLPGAATAYASPQPGSSPLDEKNGNPPIGKTPAPEKVGSGNGAGEVHVPDAQGEQSDLPVIQMRSFLAYDKKSGDDQGGMDEAHMQHILAQIRDVASSCIDLLARVMLEQQGLQRHEAVQDRMEMRALARASLMEAAGELNKQADAMQEAAIVQLVVACVTAAITMTCAVASAGFGAAGAQSTQKMGGQIPSKLTDIAKGISGAGDSAGKFGAALGSFAGTEGQVAVKQSEAAQKIDEANAQQYEAQADQKKGMQDAFEENVKQIIQFLKELKDAVADIQSAITRHA